MVVASCLMELAWMGFGGLKTGKEGETGAVGAV